MIGKIELGKSFAGILNYAEGKDGAQILDSNLASDSTTWRAAEFDAVAAGNGRCKLPVAHVSLSAPPGENASDAQWIKAAATYRREMGFSDDHQYILIKHTDQQHAHVHLIVNRVGADGKAVSMAHNFKRSREATRVAERAAGMEQFQEGQQSRGSGRIEDIRGKIDRSLDGRPGLEVFKARMAKEGFDVLENRSQTTGRLSGLSFKSREDGKVWKGSEIGKGYSANNLKKRGLDIDDERKHDLLKNRNTKPKPSRLSNNILGKMGAPKISLPTPTGLLKKAAKATLAL
ncbi:MAG: relaxase/mobilization nuclease domain-containing protein [Alphaproteobacteria bacterium]